MIRTTYEQAATRLRSRHPAASRHAARRCTPLLPAYLMLAALLLVGCAPRPGAAVLAPVPPDAQARQVAVHVATTREPEIDKSLSFGKQRSAELRYARYTISIPPQHKPADIEWPRTLPPDPAKDFAVLESGALVEPEFLDDLNAAAAKADGKPPLRDVFIFVHGYNTNFPEALFRMAQMEADTASVAVPVLFTWPSDGALAGYVADKDAATASRDQLALLLTRLTQDARFGQVHLGAHSMGCWLAMESLRQLRMAGKSDVLAKLGTVVLAAPDIDLDVFIAQAQVVGPLDPPLTVLTSPDDRALSLSNRLGGERQRLGNLDVSDDRIQALAQSQQVQLIDISDVAATDSLNHDKFLNAAAGLQKLLAKNPEGNPLRKAGAFVLKAAATVLEVPGRLGRAVAQTAGAE